MTENATPTNLYLNMAKILGEVQRIPKNGYNSHFKYDFVSEGDITDAIREHLSKHNIALFSSMKHWEQNGNKTICDFEFTLVCAETGMSHVSLWSAEANDSQDKGFNKAATAAMKYWLLKTFMIPTGDDPDADHNKGEGKKKQGDKWPTAESVNTLIKSAVQKLEVTADEISKYTEIASLDDLSAWEKYADINTAKRAIKAAHDKHMAEIAASKPAEPKNPPPKEEVKHDLNQWINGNVNAWIAKWTAEGVTHPQLKAALKIKDRWGEWKGTVSEADQAVEAYRKPKAVPPEVEAAQAAKIIQDEQAPESDPAADRLETLAELENQLVSIYRVEKRDHVAGTGFKAGYKWLAKATFFDSTETEQRIEFTLWPEDVTAIEKAGHNFPKTDFEVYIPVVLTIKSNAIRIKGDKVPKKDTTPVDSQQMFDELPGMSKQAKNQLEHA